jgi:O-antigen/teichoic acid export membrane protein
MSRTVRGTGSRLARNSLINLVGTGLPLLVAVVAIPLLIAGLGTERFGILTLAWAVIGYFGLFDMGLGRALTQVVAERLGTGDDRQAPRVVWTALACMLAVGLLGAGLMAALARPLTSVLEVDPSLFEETVAALRVLAIGIPFVVVTAGLIGLLAAYQRFGVINAVRTPMAILGFAGPLVILPFTNSLVGVMAVLTGGRAVACAALGAACYRLVPPPGGLSANVSLREIRPLVRFGAWMTISNVISPLLIYIDRFLIGALVSAAAVAYYTTPYEVVTRLTIIPGALIAVLFPAFAEAHQSDPERTVRLFARSTKYVALVLFPLVLLIVAFAREGLDLWLGADFAARSTRVLQVLAIGVFANSLAQVAFNLVQGMGRADVTARLHILEAVIYVPVLWWAIGAHGAMGAAVAWTGRVALDGALLFWACARSYPGYGLVRRLGTGSVGAMIVLAAPMAVEAPSTRIAVTVTLLIAFAVVCWRLVLNDEERGMLRQRVARAP